MPKDVLKPDCNFRLRTYKDGKLCEEHQSHNIITNVGRSWLRNLVGAANYEAVDAGTGHIEGAGTVSYTHLRAHETREDVLLRVLQ